MINYNGCKVFHIIGHTNALSGLCHPLHRSDSTIIHLQMIQRVVCISHIVWFMWNHDAPTNNCFMSFKVYESPSHNVSQSVVCVILKYRSDKAMMP